MTKVGPSQFVVAKNWSKNRQEKIQATKKAGPEAPENSFKKQFQNS